MSGKSWKCCTYKLVFSKENFVKISYVFQNNLSTTWPPNFIISLAQHCNFKDSIPTFSLSQLSHGCNMNMGKIGDGGDGNKED